MILGQFFVIGKNSCLYYWIQTGSGTHPASYLKYTVQADISATYKRPEGNTDQSLPFYVWVKNV